MTPAQIELVAEQFKALAEPARLRILQALRDGELSVSELIQATGLGQANLSKHLQVLYGAGFVSRRREGVSILYRLGDADVLQLCQLVCGCLERDAKRRLKAASPQRG
jgi:DNA-binding transcriptional ArsR family regulator